MATEDKATFPRNSEPADLNDNNQDGGDAIGEDSSTNITPDELELLDNAGVNESLDDDDTQLIDAQLDNTDDDGEELNEELDLTGSDLDVPGSDPDDQNDALGEGDEENNSYSTRDQDDIDEG